MMSFQQKNSKEQQQLADWLSIRAYDYSSHLFYQEETVGFILELSPLCGGSLEIDEALAGWLSTELPQDAITECFLWASPHIEGALDNYVNQHSGFQQTLAKNRRAYFMEKRWHASNDETLVLRDFRLFMSVTFPESTPVATVYQTRSTLKHVLMSINLFHRDMDASCLLSWVRSMFFPQKPVNTQVSKNKPLNEQVSAFDVSVDVTPEQLTIEQHGESESITVQTFSVTQHPEHWQSLWMGESIGSLLKENLNLPCPFMIHWVMFAEPSQTAKQRASIKLLRNEKLAQSPLGKLIPRAKKVTEDWQAAIRAMDEGDTLVQSYLQVVIWSNESERFRCHTLLRQLWQRLGFQLEFDVFLQLPYWLHAFPFSLTLNDLKVLRQNKRIKTILSKSAASLMPLQADYKGTQSPCLLLTGNRGQVFYYSPFDNDGGNYNTAVSGKSGSGKSVLMQEMMSGILGLGGKVFVLDVGRSFEGACHLHQGEYVAFDFKDPVNLNPFTHINHFQESLPMLKPLVSAMASPDLKLGPLESSLIEQAILHAWEKAGNDATISTVASYLREQKDLRAQDLGTLLFPFTKHGIYGAFFEGACTLNISNQLIVLELEELKTKKDLQQIVLMLLMYHVTESMYRGDRKTPTACIIDEAWDLLRGDMAGEIMETGCRRARKYRGAFITGTQSIRDFYQTPASQAAFENSDNVLLFSQKEEAIELMEKEGTLAMTESMKTLLKSLKTRKGQYSELLIKNPQGYSVARLLLDPFARTLYSSDPKVFAAIQKHREEGMSWSEAIEKSIALEERSHF